MKNLQENFNELLKKMRKGNKSADKRKMLANINMFLIEEMILSNL